MKNEISEQYVREIISLLKIGFRIQISAKTFKNWLPSNRHDKFLGDTQYMDLYLTDGGDIIKASAWEYVKYTEPYMSDEKFNIDCCTWGFSLRAFKNSVGAGILNGSELDGR